MRISDWSSDVCSSDLTGKDGALTVRRDRFDWRVDCCLCRWRTRQRSSGPVRTCRIATDRSPERRTSRDESFPLPVAPDPSRHRSEEHTSELQVTNAHLVCRLLLEKKKKK